MRAQTTWRRHSPLRAERQQNPLFPREKEHPAHLLRLVVLGILLIGVAAYVGAIYLFRVSVVTHEGTVTLPANVLEEPVQQILSLKRWKLFPGNAFVLVSASRLQRAIEDRIGKDDRFQSVTVTKVFPYRVHITVVERLPNLIYTNGGQDYLADRQGVITATSVDELSARRRLPRLVDQTTGLLIKSDQAIAPATAGFLFQVLDLLKTSTDVPTEFFYLPKATCLSIPTSTEKPLETIGVPTNTNTNVVENTNTANSNSATANTNSGSSASQPSDRGVGEETRPCDLRAEAVKSKDFRVHTTEGWDIYFRTTDSPNDQVARMVRVLREQHLNRTKLSYIDLRFGDQVIYK